MTNTDKLLPIGRSKHDWQAMLLSALSGGLLTAGFPRLEMALVSWVALVPLLFALQGKTSRAAFRLGYLCGLVHYVTTFYWIRNVVEQYGGVPLPLAIVVLLLMCGYLALYPALFALLAKHWEPRPQLSVWLLPTAWVALEWLRAHALSGFPWANLGYSQTPFATLIQVADVTGVYGVSWLLLLANTCITLALMRRRLHWSLAILAGCILATLIYGSGRLETIQGLQDQAKAQVAGLIQGNVDQAHKWDPAFQQATVERYLKLSGMLVNNSPPPDLLVWPETAAPFFYGLEDRFTPQLRKFVQQARIPLLFGSPTVVRVGDQPKYFNEVFLVDAAGATLGSYAKQHLVPFGEYVPFPRLLFFVQRLVQAAGDFAAGRDQRPLALNGQRFGILICYEAIFPDLSRAAVRLGASTLVNVTNDAWFGTSSAPYQHLAMARWRAIENRVPLIRCANTGISTVFEPTGRTDKMIPLNETGTLVCALHPVPVTTIYTTWGDWFAWVCVLTSVVGLVTTVRYRQWSGEGRWS
jgi:apolipoprotein N-acyltransferase